MAIDQGTEMLSVKTEERTWRVNIETPKGEVPTVTVWRETARSAPDGSIISKEQAGTINRSLSVVAAETQPFTPAVSGQISGVELAGLIAARADIWRQIDIAAEAARRAEYEAAEAARLAEQEANQQENQP